MRGALAALPDLGAALLIAAALAVFAGWWFGPRVGLTRLRAVGWLLSLAVPLALTLTATYTAGSDTCRWGAFPWTVDGALPTTDVRGNILMMVPAGAAVLLMPTRQLRGAALGAALALPLLIEGTQRLVSGLGRGCQIGDVVNNQVGVLFGLAAMAGGLALARRLHRRQPGLSAGDRPPTSALRR